MKSRTHVLFVILGVAGLALWLVWRSPEAPAVGRVALPIVSQPPPTVLPAASPPAQNQTPTAPALSASPAAVGVTPPTGAISPTAGTSVGQSAGGPGTFPNPGALALAPNQTAQIDAGRIRHMVSDYHTLMNENPVGTNAEIMKQMMGGNSRQATLGPPEGMTLNGQGELVDQWGTPYFFHQLSRDQMEVRSAGPDKVMWTDDDITSR